MASEGTSSGCSIPPELQHDFARLVCQNIFLTKLIVKVADQADYDNFASALISISVAVGENTLQTIRALIAAEFEQSFRTPGSILRGNCVASKVMGVFSRKVGGEYLDACLGDIIRSIVNDESLSLEIDPAKEPEQEKRRKNKDKLAELGQQIFDRIRSPEMLDAMPSEIRAMARFTAEYARIYSPESTIALIGGFIMLRLFNPSLVTPESFKIVPKCPPKARRNLTLLTKMLQALSNGVLFGTKEVYMQELNFFVERNKAAMQEFLRMIVHGEGEGCVTPRSVGEENKLDPKHITFFHSLLYTLKGKLFEKLQQEIDRSEGSKDFDMEEKLFQTLDLMGKPSTKNVSARSGPKRDIQVISFLCGAVKSGHLSRGKRSHKQKGRVWVVLTDTFLHFFMAPQDSIPHKSICVDEFMATKETGSNFRLTYYRKEHTITCASSQEADDWVTAITEVKRQRAKVIGRTKDRKKSPLEQRIQNYMLGLKLSFKVTFRDFYADKNGKIKFKFCVEAFGNKYTLLKEYDEIASFHLQLVETFPRLIFPVFPRKVADPESLMNSTSTSRQLNATSDTPHQTSSVQTNLQKFAPLSQIKKLGKPHGVPSFSLPAQQEEWFPRELLCHYKGSPSLAVMIACKFIRCFFEELISTLEVRQSQPMLEFLRFMCPLHAVQYSSVKQLQFLQIRNASFNTTDDRLRGVWHIAAANRDLDMLNWLSSANAGDMNQRDDHGQTPLMVAVEQKHEEVAMFLLRHGADPNVVDKKRATALHLACERGLVGIISTLLKNGADCNKLDEKGWPPVQRAIPGDYLNVLELLVRNGVNLCPTDPDGNTLLHVAVMYSAKACLRRLLQDKRLNVNSQGSKRVSALHIAAATGNVDVVRYLCKCRIDLCLKDDRGFTVLHTASLLGRLEVVNVLCQQDQLDVNCKTNDGQTALHISAENDQTEIIQRLLLAKASVDETDKRGNTPLLLAVIKGNFEIASMLLDAGANPNARDKQKRFPLRWAAITGRSDICELLLSHGACATLVDLEGSDSLHAAAWAKHSDVGEILLLRGAAINKPDMLNSETALHVAVQTRSQTFTQMLLKQGARVNAKKIDGSTPLHLAAAAGDMRMVRILATCGAAVDAQNVVEDTPLHVAVRHGYDDVAVLLVSLGADLNATNKHGVTPVTEAKGAFRNLLKATLALK